MSDITEVLDQRRRLDAIAAERAADRPADTTDPNAWHRRENDRAALEHAAATRIHTLRTAAGNAAALAEPRPQLDEDECHTCGRPLPDGRGQRTAAGLSCIGCAGLDEAEKALLRTARQWPHDQLAAQLDDLPDSDLRTLRGLVGKVARHQFTLHHEVGQAVQRRPHRGAWPVASTGT